MTKWPTHRYRRRRCSLFSMPTAALVMGVGSLFLGSVRGARRVTTESLVPLDTATLTSNMRHWTTDYAVMFYAPWCNHCKEAFMPLWQDVAMHLAEEDPRGKRKLVMGKFNCEQDTAAASFCQEIKLQFYPTFMFFGSGKFHDHDPVSGVVLGPRPTEHDSSAKFPSSAMVYHEIMADWVKTMHLISGSNRAMEKLSFFRGSNQASSEERLVAEIEALERQNQHLQQAMAGGSGGAEKEDASELPYGYGDPYRELWEVSYEAQFEPVMSCVIDMSVQYCNVDGIKEKDPWCSTLESCIATDFVEDECWPSSCPLLPEGCQITSFCLTQELLESYMEMFQQENEYDEAAAAVAAADVPGSGTWAGIGAAAEQAGDEQQGDTEQAGTFPGLPPFLGRRPTASAGGGVDRTADERGETVAA